MKINLDKLYKKAYLEHRFIAGWSSPVARQAHNLKVGGSNPPPATNMKTSPCDCFFYVCF